MLDTTGHLSIPRHTPFSHDDCCHTIDIFLWIKLRKSKFKTHKSNSNKVTCLESLVVVGLNKKACYSLRTKVIWENQEIQSKGHEGSEMSQYGKHVK